MNLNKLLFVTILVIVAGCSKSFRSISLAIDQKQRGGQKTEHNFTFHDVRMKLFQTNKLDFLKNSDTLFMLESFNVEEATFYGKVWTTSKSVQYFYRNNQFYFKDQLLFTNYFCELINRWDTTTIRADELQYSNIIPEQWVAGTRIIQHKGNPQIDIIKFKRFFRSDKE